MNLGLNLGLVQAVPVVTVGPAPTHFIALQESITDFLLLENGDFFIQE